MKKREILDGVSELAQDSSGSMRNLIGRWFNYVLDDIASRGLLKSLQREERASLVASQRDYTLASDTDQIFKVFVPAWGDPDGILGKLSLDEFLAKVLKDGVTLESKPQKWTLFGRNTLRLHPIPDLANAPASPTNNDKLHIWKYKDIAHLVEEDEITEIKLKHLPVILQGVYAFAARFDELGDVTDANAKYEIGVSRIIADSRLDLNRPYAAQYRDI